MKPLLVVTFLAIIIEIVSSMTFRLSDFPSTTERTKRRQPSQQIIFGNTTTTTIRTTTSLPVFNSSLPTQFSTTTLNSTAEWNNITSGLLNSTDPSLVHNDSTVIDPLKTRSSVNTEACLPESMRDAEDKSHYYLSDNDIRLKLCSNINSSLLREYRFDLESKICSLVGKQSHCGTNMIFYSFAGNNVYGHCDCDYSSKIPLIYHQQTKRCYFMYQQGYCGTDEWLEMSRGNGTGVCTKNKCYNVGRTKFGAPPLAARDMAPEYVPLHGDGPCVLLNQPNPKFCKNRGDIVAFRWPLKVYPTCVQPVKKAPATEAPSGISGRFLGEVASLKCNPGSYLTAVGTCEPEWEFD